MQSHYIGPGPVSVGTDAEDLPDEDDEAPPGAPPSAPASFIATAAHGGWRIDRALAALFPEMSRSRIQTWIDGGGARVNGRTVRSSDRVYAGDRMEIEVQPPEQASAFEAEAMALPIVHEDESVIVINKPAGLVVHPGAGNWSGTLLNGLLAHQPGLAAVPRAGIVHRLDAGTSGLMVVAKTIAAQTDLVRQLQQRQVVREYWALVSGSTVPAGRIEASLARDPRNRLRFRVSQAATAREARTTWRRIKVSLPGAGQVGAALSWLACRLDTGRTHQIRVHLESIGHPIVGDPMYRRGRPALGGAAQALTRQALHACRLAFRHPGRGDEVSWFEPPPQDMRSLMIEVGFAPDRPVEIFGREPQA